MVKEEQKTSFVSIDTSINFIPVLQEQGKMELKSMSDLTGEDGGNNSSRGK